ncbi:MAG: glycosyltransferase family 39 protein [Victivallaceae bacterium]|jgi:hypothetical protein
MESPDARMAAEDKTTGIDAFSLKGFYAWRNIAMLLLVCALSLWINLRGITTGLPSAERLDVSLGGAAVMERKLPEIQAAVAAGLGNRSEFLVKSNADNFRQLAYFSPYFDQLRTFNPDEFFTFKVLKNMADNRTINPGYYIYGPFYFYQIGASLAFSRVTGILDPVKPPSHYLTHPEEFARFFLCGRVFSALMSTLAVAVTFLIGYRIGKLPLAAFAASLLAFIPLFSLAAKFIKPDSITVFWTSLVILFAIPVLVRSNWIYYILSGICIGLSAGCKYPAAVNASYLVMFHLLRRYPEIRNDGKWLVRDDFKLAAAGGITIAAFLLSCPPVILDWTAFRGDLQWTQSVARPGNIFGNIIESVMCYGYDALFYTVGIPGFIAIAGGLILCICRPGKIWTGMFPGILLFLFVASRGLDTSDAYMLPAYIPLCLMAGRFVFCSKKTILSSAAAVLIVTGTFSYSLAYANVACGEDVRLTAAKWINQNIRAGSVLGSVLYPVGYRLPMVSPEKYRLVNLKIDGFKAFEEADYQIYSSYDWSEQNWLGRVVYGEKNPLTPGTEKVIDFESVPRTFFGLLPLNRNHRLNHYFEVVSPVISIYKNIKTIKPEGK